MSHFYAASDSGSKLLRNMSHFCGASKQGLGRCRATCPTSMRPQTNTRTLQSKLSYLCGPSDEGSKTAEQHVSRLWGFKNALGSWGSHNGSEAAEPHVPPR